MVFAGREDPTNQFVGPADIPELPLSALTAPALRSLLEERVGARRPDHVLGELAHRTGGNPLAVIEAPAQLNPGQLTGADVLPQDLPLSARMGRTFLDRCRRLSAPGRRSQLEAEAVGDVHQHPTVQPPVARLAAGLGGEQTGMAQNGC